MPRRGWLLWLVIFCIALFTPGCPPDGISTESPTDGTDTGTAGNPLPPAEILYFHQGSGRIESTTLGDLVRLEALPDAGWRFDRWTGDVQSAANPLTISASESLTISAVFVEDTRPLDPEPPSPVPTAPDPNDEDGDGVPNPLDQCPGTPSGATVNAVGCSMGQLDSDRDGVPDALDACPGTVLGTAVDAAGCSASQRDTDGDGVVDAKDLCPGTPPGVLVLANGCPPETADSDGDGVPNVQDRCPETPAGAVVDPNTGCRTGELPFCGNGVLESGEQCEPPNTPTCDAACRSIGTPPANDLCSAPASIPVGSTSFNTSLASTTGTVPVASGCIPSDFQKDLWFCHTATCTGQLTVSTCPGSFDLMLAVYNGCACPTSTALACDDDGCGVAGRGSVASVQVTAGQSYMIRVGGWRGEEGLGSLTIACAGTTAVCGNGIVEAGEACDPPNGTTCNASCQTIVQTPVCGNGSIEAGEQCEPPNTATCDANCQTIAGAAVCGNGVIEAGEDCEPPGLGNCGTDCRTLVSQAICGNGVIESGEECEPPSIGICDAQCRIRSIGQCGPEAGDCCSPHADPGCSIADCCQRVCNLDPFCCGGVGFEDGAWDADCVAKARRECTSCATGCIAPCPLGAISENEANCGLPIDSVNGGCIFDSFNPRTIPLTCDGPARCGTAAFSGNFGDTDWYEIAVSQATEINVSVTAEFAAGVAFVHTSPPGTAQCAAFANFSPFNVGTPCETVTVRNCVLPGRYWIMVFPWRAEPLACGSRYTMEVSCAGCSAAPPNNDTCSNAQSVALGGSARGITRLAALDAVPACGGIAATAPGIWYRVIGNGSRLTASTCAFGTDFDTVLTVYCNGCFSPTCVAVNDDAIDTTCGSTSEVSWCSQPNAEYLILVHGFERQAGEFELYLTSGGSCSNPVSCGGLSGGPCGPGRGSCFDPHANPGCETTTCCESVCAIDSTCCTQDWDSDCVQIANIRCGP